MTIDPSPSLRPRVSDHLVRWLLVWFALLLFPVPFDGLPVLSRLADAWYDGSEQAAAVLAGLAGVPADQLRGSPTSSDTLLDYWRSGLLLLLALLAALLRVRRPASHWRERLRTYVRWALATTLFSYGMAKVSLVQFPAPTTDRLLQRFGDASPMGLLWTFMGFSPIYQRATGLVEVLAAVLLVPRRTAPLGALLASAAMLQVVLLNVTFDVSVKLFATQLLAMSLLLASPVWRPLWQSCCPPVLAASRRRRWAVAAFSLYVVVTVVQDEFAQRALQRRSTWGALAGVWAPAGDAPTDVRYLVLERGEMLALVDSLHGRRRQAVRRDSTGLWRSPDGMTRLSASGDTLVRLLQDSLPPQVFRRTTAPPALLVTRGFHWTTPAAFNR